MRSKPATPRWGCTAPDGRRVTHAAPSLDRRILRLALPAMAALAADPLLSLVDTALVGRLGAVPLAALGIDSAVFSTVFVAFNFLTYGTTAAVARRRGAGDDAGAAVYAVQALWLAVGLGVLATIGLLVAGRWIVGAMGASDAVVPDALAYLHVRAFAAVPLLVVQVGHGVFRGLQDTRTPLLVAVATNVVNGTVSWVLIYPADLGVAGAAAGTLLAEALAAVALLVLARRRLPTAPLRIERVAMRAIVRVSRDLFLRTLALVGGLLVTTAVAARMGTLVVAAHQIGRELWLLLALVLDGFAIAGQAMVATALGAGDRAAAIAAGRRLLRWGLVAGTGIGVIYLLLVGMLPGVFTSDAQVTAEVRRVWIVIAVLQPIGGIVFVLDGILMGAGDFRFLFLSTAVAAGLFLVPASLAALAFGWGLPGVWAAMSALMVVRLIALWWRWRTGAWTRARVAP